MGLLDMVIGSLMGGSGASSPMASVLSSLLGGGQQQPGGMGGGSGMGGSGMGGSGMGGSGMGGLGGGLGGLVSQFQNAGLGNIVQSWIGNGPNHPVTPDQLQNVLGHDQVQSMANQAGMDQGDFLSQLSQHLPNAVNGMTPDGQLPDEGTVSV